MQKSFCVDYKDSADTARTASGSAKCRKRKQTSGSFCSTTTILQNAPSVTVQKQTRTSETGAGLVTFSFNQMLKLSASRCSARAVTFM